ncbi:cell adhesion molecule Dscam2-like [Parasteatoda tepidariorum]|uniref:cell adhesion molecule Dscam2-like n=1 Tax=Parasteatoda tepidariorum TaxID=114398 RepID=UPI0039BC2B4F
MCICKKMKIDAKQILLLKIIMASFWKTIFCGDPPIIAPFMFSPVLKEGETANTFCSIRSGDKPLEFKWIKDGQPLPVSPTVNVQSFEDSSVLFIKSVDSGSSGNYTCIVTNSFGKDQYTASLVVTAPPVWLKEPTETVVKEGESVSIECQATGVPSPNIRWKTEVKGVTITSDSSSTIHVTSIGTLIISKVIYSMEGSYTCEAENGFGPPLTKTISLTVRGMYVIPGKSCFLLPVSSIEVFMRFVCAK